MDVVIDANILFALLIKHGNTEDLLFKEDLHVFAPEFLFDEFEKYKQLILEKTDKNEKEFNKFLDVVKKRIKIIPNEETERFIEKAKNISPDMKDADYFALALKLNCYIWSNDRKLREKQNIVKIYSTEDLFKVFS
jgi:predicted nucleic acid-binding protein